MKVYTTDLILNLPLVVLTNVTTYSFKSTDSSIFDLFHMNVFSQFQKHLSNIWTSKLDTTTLLDHQIFCMSLGLLLMLQESLEKYYVQNSTLP